MDHYGWKATAKKFLEDVFTNTNPEELSFISCGLSEHSLAKLEPRQKENLLDYAEHLDPDLKRKLKERESCGRISYIEIKLDVKVLQGNYNQLNMSVDQRFRHVHKAFRARTISTYIHIR